MDTVISVVTFLLIFAVVLVGATFVVTRIVLGRTTSRARRALPPGGPGIVDDTVACLTKPYKGFGILRLAPDALMFASGVNGDVVTIPRDSLVGSTSSVDVPTGSGMATLQKPALVIQISDPTIGEGMAFAVSDSGRWVERINAWRVGG